MTPRAGERGMHRHSRGDLEQPARVLKGAQRRTYKDPSTGLSRPAFIIFLEGHVYDVRFTRVSVLGGHAALGRLMPVLSRVIGRNASALFSLEQTRKRRWRRVRPYLSTAVN
jgi:hypothetical protein